ncbi:zinc finger, CCHC-type containing protein [Tanacetum coccineum]
MGDANPIRTLGDYSKPCHEGYKNTIELPEGNNVVPLRSDTIRLVQNGCSFHGHRSKDPNQHLKDFLKLVDSLDLDGANRERTRMHLFQFSLRNQASNWLERLPAGSISTWEDLTTRFLAQFFPSGRISKLCNDILIGPHNTQYCMESPKQAFVDYASSRIDETGSRQFAMNQGPISFNKASNACKGKPNFNWAHTQTFTSPRNGSFSTYSSNYQMKFEKALIDFDSHQEKILSIIRTQLRQQQDDMISKINLL